MANSLILPHLLLAHFVGDYLLQSGWLVDRKNHTWDGLFLHVLFVWVMSLLAVAPYLDQMWLPILALFAFHWGQDWVKIRFSHLFEDIHLAWLYFADQALHVVVLMGIQAWVYAHTQIQVGAFEVFIMSLGTCLIVVTRFYDVSWWGNWYDMILYMHKWQLVAYLERALILMVAMLGVGGVMLAPTIALPRLYLAWQQGRPLWQEKRGLLEWGLGIVVSLALGYAVLHPLLTQAFE